MIPMPKETIYALNALAATLGVLLIVGARRRWRWLVDPPSNMWPYYSQAFLKHVFGPWAPVCFAYFVAALIIAASLWGTFNVLSRN